MKIDSYHRSAPKPLSNRRQTLFSESGQSFWRATVFAWICACSTAAPQFAMGQRPTAIPERSETSDADPEKTIEPARRLLARVIEQIALGPAFDAKIRQRVQVGDREVIGVGTYEQAGDGSGWFNLQVAMHDGDGKHTLQQISDGRLAWTREQIGDEVTLQRVDVGRLDQWVQGAVSPVYHHDVMSGDPVADHLPPSVRVGAWTEMLERIAADHDLTLASGRLEQREVWIVRGKLRTDVRAIRLTEFGTETWPKLCPTEVVVAIAKSVSPETGFGKGLPLRIEFWADPVATLPSHPAASNKSDASNDDVANSMDISSNSETPSNAEPQTATSLDPTLLISVIELYSIRPISSPPIGRFRFENQDMEVNFTNDTSRYLSRYGIHITERQSRMLRR